VVPAATTLYRRGTVLSSRLIIGTGKYKDYAQNAAALEASGAEMVTVALRRVNVMEPGAPRLVDFIDPKNMSICEYRWLFYRRGCSSHAQAGARSRRLDAGEARSAG